MSEYKNKFYDSSIFIHYHYFYSIDSKMNKLLEQINNIINFDKMYDFDDEGIISYASQGNRHQ